MSRSGQTLVPTFVACLVSAVVSAVHAGSWSASKEPIEVMDGMDVPESALFDPGSGLLFVANIVGKGWEADEVGFISMSRPGEDLDILHWRQATPKARLSAPKGMCVLDGWLWVADITRVHKFRLNSRSADTIEVPGSERMNDVATDGTAVFVSDTARGVIYRISPADGEVTEIPAVPSINGITFHGRRLIAVSWDLHEIYEIDPTGRNAPRPFGLEAHFTALDGVEVLEDGSYVVSDFLGNKVCWVSADEQTVTTLVQAQSPADIGLDRSGRRLFVPEFNGNRVLVYALVPSE